MAVEKLPEFAKDGQKNVDGLTETDGFPVNLKPARQWFNWLFNTLTTKINEIIDGKLDSDATAVAAQKLQTSRRISFSGAATGSFNFDGSKGESCVLTLANSGAEAGTYGTTLKIPVITVNAKGLITTATTQDIPSASTSAKGLVQLNDTLTSTSTTQALTAAQGKALQDDKLGKNENAATATKLQTARTIGGVSFDGTANISLPGVNTAGNQDTSGNAATATTAAACSGNAASATDCSRSVIAGNGLSGGGALTSNRTVTLGTPGNITATSTNSVTETSHTHNLDINSLPLLGVGQTWRNFTGNRVVGVTYTNTTGKPIQVSILKTDTQSTMNLYVSGELVAVCNNNTSERRQPNTITAIVPAGATYYVSGGAIDFWKELR